MMSDHLIGWLWMFTGWLLATVGLWVLAGGGGLVFGGLLGLLLGASVVDWEVTASGEPSRSAHQNRNRTRV